MRNELLFYHTHDTVLFTPHDFASILCHHLERGSMGMGNFGEGTMETERNVCICTWLPAD